VDPNAYQVNVAFPEADAVKVKPDQSASITVDALPGTTLTGKVLTVASSATVTSNVVTYAATISVDNPPPTVRAGMTVSVTVTVQTKANVVVVQTAAIETQGAQSFVNKVQNGQTVRTPVTVGLQGDSTTEITSGLAAGDQVAISTGSITTNTAPGNRTGAGAGGAGIPGAGGGFGGGGGGGGFRGGGAGGAGGAGR
jgi:macrolide-specific efflux system membrane fusion protein